MVTKKLFYDLVIRVQSTTLGTIKKFDKEIVTFFKELHKGSNVRLSSVKLPNEKKKITIIKSPHVYKKGRDQLEVKFYSRLYTFSFLTPLTYKKWELSSISKDHTGDLHFKSIIKKRYE